MVENCRRPHCQTHAYNALRPAKYWRQR